MANSTYPCEECGKSIHWGDHVCTHCSAYQYDPPASIGNELAENSTDEPESLQRTPMPSIFDPMGATRVPRLPASENSEESEVESLNAVIDQVRSHMKSDSMSLLYKENWDLYDKAKKSMHKAISETIPELSKIDVQSVMSHISSVWEPNRLYRSGDFLIRMYFRDTVRTKVVYVVTMWCQQSHINANPIHFLANLGGPNNQQWMLGFAQFDQEGPKTNIVLDGDGTMAPMANHHNESKNKQDDVLHCEWCEAENRAKLKVETTGKCTYCPSTKYIFGDEMVSYDIHKKAFFCSMLETEGRQNLDEIWGSLSSEDSITLEDTREFRTLKESRILTIEELMTLETKLHHSSAALYANLRSIGLSYPNQISHSPAILRELVWINNQIERIMVKLKLPKTP